MYILEGKFKKPIMWGIDQFSRPFMGIKCRGTSRADSFTFTLFQRDAGSGSTLSVGGLPYMRGGLGGNFDPAHTTPRTFLHTLTQLFIDGFPGITLG